ncbi:MAG: DUF72 domain-containing protein [Candidatus Thermoplasmatota archaeon]|nr:DUF72 domain-containing protein [Candidatus Thermoplasmatota archaeon]
MGRIRIGNSGWSYKDWLGPVYPEGCPSKDLLGYYFSMFDTVEVNSTFYTTPSSSAVQAWSRTARTFNKRELTVKVPGRISHESCMEDEPVDMFRALDEFDRAVLSPLKDDGVLGAVLFQASPYFTVRGDIKYKMKAEPRVPLPGYVLGLKRLRELGEKMASLPGYPALELRNSSWLNEELRLIEEARDILREFGIALVVVDGPSFPWFTEETARHTYIRFHGRNKEAWFRTHGEGEDERYSYDYPESELRERLDPLRIMASKVDRDTRIYFNNHPRGMAPKNAIRMRELLGLSAPPGALDNFL